MGCWVRWAPASNEEVAGSSLGAALLQCGEHLHNDTVNNFHYVIVRFAGRNLLQCRRIQSLHCCLFCAL